MRLEAAVLAYGLFAEQCLASGGGFEVAHGLHRRHAHFHEQMRREADAVVHQMEKRNDVFDAPAWPTVVVPAGFTLAGGVQITPEPSTTTTFSALATATPTSIAALQSSAAIAAAQQTGDQPEWTAEAEKSCMTAVMSLKGQASNPAGLAVCYNVPYLDEKKGVFEAELRMFNISNPTGDFVGMTPEQMMVTLRYNGATIQRSDGTQLPAKRDLVARQMLTLPSGVAMEGGPSGEMPGGIRMPLEIAIRQYVGQVNKDLMDAGLDSSEYRTLLVPQIEITGVNPANQKQVQTPLSSSEASFNAGVFAKAAGNATDPASILGNPQEQIAAAAQGLPTPYDVPGLSLGVFPTGLIVTSVWMLIFLGVVGMGTVQRQQWRDQYRRNVRAQKEEGQRRI